MGKDVKVRFTADDQVTPALLGMSSKLKSFAAGVAKFAAGFGAVETIKQVGRAIAGSIRDAAAAYPQLGAGFQKVTAGFSEFRIQAGAAFLSVLQPIAPLLEGALRILTKFATEIPVVFDKTRVSLAHVGDWFLKLPWLGRAAFGELADAAGKFMTFFGAAEVGVRMQAWGAGMVAAARNARAAIDAETTAWAAGILGRDYGTRAGPKAPSGQAAAGPVGKPQLSSTKIIDERVEQTRSELFDAQTNEELGLTSGIESMGAAYERGLEPLLAFNEALMQQGHIFDGLVSPAMSGTMDAIFGLTQALAQSLPGHSAVAKAAAFAAKAIAKIEGGIAIAKGGVKIAESIFPPNPAGLASGAGMVTQGIKLMSLGGGAAGAGGYTGGHGGSGPMSGGDIYRTGRDLASRGKMILNIKDGVMGTRSAEFRDMIVDLMRTAGDLRELEIQST